MLEDYAGKNEYENLCRYTDDGWSGATFERPDWKRLIEDVEQGKIGTVIVKDMSRVGRDYLQVGFYTEIMFRGKGGTLHRHFKRRGQREKGERRVCAVSEHYE